MGKGTPDKELVDTARPTIGVAADQIDVHPLQIGGGIGPPRQLYLGEILDVTGQNSLQPIWSG